jgi:hypothetical protein
LPLSSASDGRALCGGLNCPKHWLTVKGLAWPIVILVLALKFKPELLSAVSSLFGRKVELEGLGFKIGVAEQQAVVEKPPLSETPSSFDPSPRQAINLVETRLRNELKEVDAGKREAVLLRSLAQSRLDGAHESMYNRMYGSQIALLRLLNEELRVSIGKGCEFFKPYAETFPRIYDNYSFEAWLNFMTVNALVVQKGNDFEISEFGRDF